MTRRADLFTRLSYALAWVRGQTDLTPAVGVILGSGLSGFADGLLRASVVPYEQIPGFPVSKVAGHPGRLVVGELMGDPHMVTLGTLRERGEAAGFRFERQVGPKWLGFFARLGA